MPLCPGTPSILWPLWVSECCTWMLQWVTLSFFAGVSVLLIQSLSFCWVQQLRQWQRNICLYYSASTPDSNTVLLFLRDWDSQLLPIWNVSCLSEWSEAARTMDTQCPGDGAPLHCWEHRLSSHGRNVRQGKTNENEKEPEEKVPVMLKGIGRMRGHNNRGL